MIRHLPGPGVINPFRGDFRPQWPLRINMESPQAEGLAVWWPMSPAGGSEIRGLGFGHPGSSAGLTTTGTFGGNAAWVATDWGWSIDFDGTNSYVEVVNSPANITGEITVVAYVIFDAATADVRVMSHWGNTNAERQWLLSLGTSGVPQFARQSSGTFKIATGPSAVSTGRLYVLAGRYDGANTEVFLDGVSVGSSAGALTAVSTAHALRLGHEGDGSGSNYLNGRILDARIYTSALSDAVLVQMADPRTRWDLYRSRRSQSFAFEHIVETITLDKFYSPLSIPARRTLRRSPAALSQFGTIDPVALTIETAPVPEQEYTVWSRPGVLQARRRSHAALAPFAAYETADAFTDEVVNIDGLESPWRRPPNRLKRKPIQPIEAIDPDILTEAETVFQDRYESPWAKPIIARARRIFVSGSEITEPTLIPEDPEGAALKWLNPLSQPLTRRLQYRPWIPFEAFDPEARTQGEVVIVTEWFTPFSRPGKLVQLKSVSQFPFSVIDPDDPFNEETFTQSMQAIAIPASRLKRGVGGLRFEEIDPLVLTQAEGVHPDSFIAHWSMPVRRRPRLVWVIPFTEFDPSTFAAATILVLDGPMLSGGLQTQGF